VAAAANSGDPLVAAADALYGLRPGEFTAARNDRAKAAKAAGDKALGAELGRLPKPSAAAWGVNMLVRHRTAEIDQLLELGRTMRAAQEELDSDTLRTLGTQRRAVIGAVAKQARSLARELGQSLGEPAVEEIEQTLQAAMADAHAAAAVRTGRLVRPLTTVGFEPVDLTDAVALPGDLTDDGPPTAAKSRPPVRLEDARRKKRIAEAQRELDEARRQAEDSEAEVAAADERLADATADRERLSREREELEERLEQLATELAGAAKRLRELARAKDEAEDAREEAKRATDRAGRRLREAESG
jgi:DNA repair exonuclease SbcCD ATPase subunit